MPMRERMVHARRFRALALQDVARAQAFQECLLGCCGCLGSSCGATSRLVGRCCLALCVLAALFVVLLCLLCLLFFFAPTLTSEHLRSWLRLKDLVWAS